MRTSKMRRVFSGYCLVSTLLSIVAAKKRKSWAGTGRGLASPNE